MIKEEKVKVFEFLKGHTFNIEELEQTLQLNNRETRALIAEYAKEKPVISLSQEKGYRFIDEPQLIDVNDVKFVKEMVEHQIKDLESRIAKLSERIIPLEQWLDEYDNHNVING